MATIQRNIDIGRAAIRAGDVDYHCAQGNHPIGYADVLASIMHSADADGVDFDTAVERARQYHDAEVRDES